MLLDRCVISFDFQETPRKKRHSRFEVGESSCTGIADEAISEDFVVGLDSCNNVIGAGDALSVSDNIAQVWGSDFSIFCFGVERPSYKRLIIP